MSLFLETICVRDGIFQHLAYHEARMRRTTGKTWHLQASCEQARPENLADWVKCRVLYDFERITHIEFLPYLPKPPQTLRLVEANDLAYSLKYADRTALNAIFAQRGEADDVLIVKNGYIADTSYCNVAFFDGRDWLTPALPLLEGTARARLLEKRRVLPALITIKDLPAFERIRLFNAMLDFEADYEARIWQNP